MSNDEFNKVELFKLNQLRQKILRAQCDLEAGNTHDGETLLESLCDGEDNLDHSKWV